MEVLENLLTTPRETRTCEDCGKCYPYEATGDKQTFHRHQK